MTSLTVISQKPARRFAIPLTLSAAVLAMALVGSLLLSRGVRLPNVSLSMLAQPTSTPTPAPTVIPTLTPFIPVLAGTGNCGLFVTQQMVEVQAQITELQNHQNDLVNAGANLNSPSAIAQNNDDLRTTAQELQQAQQLYTALAASCNPNTNSSALSGELRTPISIPMSAVVIQSAKVIPADGNNPLQLNEGLLMAGDNVDVLAVMLMAGEDPNLNLPGTVPVPSGTPSTSSVMASPIAQNVPIVQISNTPEDGSTPQPTTDSSPMTYITLAVTADENTILQWALQTKIPLTLARSTAPEFGLKPIVIVSQSLPIGAQLSPASLALAYWPAALVPNGEVADPSAFVGKYLNTSLEAGQPVTNADVTDQSIYVGQRIPHGMVGTDILRQWITGIPSDLKAGDTVDISLSLLNTKWPQDSVEASNTIPSNGLVARKTVFKGIHIASMSGINSPDAVDVYWTPEDAFLLTWVTDSGLPFALTLTRSNDSTANALQPQTLPDGKVSVLIPAEKIGGHLDLPDTLTAPVNAQIVAHLTFFTHLSDPTAGEKFESQDVAQIVVSDAQITASSADGYKVTISADDLPELQWFIQAGVPLTVFTLMPQK